jgi:hypothetical protein
VATTRNTKRPLNRCASCGKTWYPRGGNLSSRCPKCGSGKTKLAGLGIIGTLGSLFLMFVMGGHPDNHNSTTGANPTENSVRSVGDLSSSSQLNNPAEVGIAQSSSLRGASEGAALQPQATLAPTLIADQAESAKSAASEIRDATNTTQIGPAAAPDVAAGNATFMHH